MKIQEQNEYGIKSRLYGIWCAMKRRCFNQNVESYKYYGARGVNVCNEWLDYIPFRDWALSNGYSDDLSIDRIDVNGDYEPSNCRWADIETQMNNTRSNKRITYNGEKHTIAEWSRITGIHPTTIGSRIRKGLPLDKVFCKGRVEMKTNGAKAIKSRDLIADWYKKGLTCTEIGRRIGVGPTAVISFLKREGLFDESRLTSNHKIIVHYDSEGNLIGRYMSTTEASKAVGMSASTISMYCRGKSKPRNKHIWKYESV